MAIIAILAVLAAMSLYRVREKAKVTRISTELEEIAQSVTQYAADHSYQYPADTFRAVPPGLEKYLQGGTWPTSVFQNGVFDWENWLNNGKQVFQISYHLCDITDPIEYCSDPILFPQFVRDSSIYYCISGPCIPHQYEPFIPGYCVNCKPKEVNYTP